MNNKTIKEIAKKSNKYLSDYDAVGVRVQESSYGLRVGDTVEHQSHVWDDGSMMSETLSGVSAVSVRTANWLSDFGGYDGNVYLVLGSNQASGGEDISEIIMLDPVILEIIEQ